LTSVASVSGVNALAAGETLSFGPKLTVVYGYNGAGRSGVMHVCLRRQPLPDLPGQTLQLFEGSEPHVVQGGDDAVLGGEGLSDL